MPLLLPGRCTNDPAAHRPGFWSSPFTGHGAAVDGAEGDDQLGRAVSDLVAQVEGALRWAKDTERVSSILIPVTHHEPVTRAPEVPVELGDAGLALVGDIDPAGGGR